MKKILSIVIILCVILSAVIIYVAVQKPEDNLPTNPLLINRKLVWSDEFENGEASFPDSENSKFSQKVDTMGGVSPEVTFLSVSKSRDNCFVQDGNLVMRITSDGNKNYVIPSPISTCNKMAFKYGYLEMRAKVPYVSGTWPSFWLRPALDLNQSAFRGEIDIFEIYGTREKKGNTTKGVGSCNIHKWIPGGGSCNSSQGNRVFLEDIYNTNFKFDPNEYHIFGFEWTSDFVAFYIDGELYSKIAVNDESDFCTHDSNEDGIYDHAGNMDCFDQYYFICLNIWAFSEYDYPWIANQSIDRFPDVGNVDYSVDYVRLYQNAETESVHFY